MENNKDRKIKITQKYFPRAWKDVIFPEIRLTGKWLQDAGFICGQFVSITQQGNSITITALPAAQEQQPVKKAKCKKDSFLSPELANLPINELFRQWPAVEFHEYMDKLYKDKNKKKSWKVSRERAWDNFKNDLKIMEAKLLEKQKTTAAQAQIVEMDIRPGQVADK